MNSHVNDLRTVSKLILICGCSHSSLHFFSCCFCVALLNISVPRCLSPSTLAHSTKSNQKRKNVCLVWLTSKNARNSCRWLFIRLEAKMWLATSERERYMGRERKRDVHVSRHEIREWITHFYGHLICRHLRLSKTREMW